MAESSPLPDVSELLNHAEWLQRLARSLVRDDAAAEDLVQDTWLTALRTGPRDGERARPWLARVLQNRLRSVERSKKRRGRREAEVAPHEALPSTAALSERAESARLLLAAVLELPEAQRQVLLLSYFEGLSITRIAALTTSSEVAVRSRITRAVAALRERLDKRSDGDSARWLQALVPLAGVQRLQPPVALAALAPAATIGALTMILTSKVVAAAAAVLVLGLALRTFDRSAPGPSDELGVDPVGAIEVAESASGESASGARTIVPEIDRTQPTRTAHATVASANAPVRGALVDAESGAPLPYYALGIASGEAVPYTGPPEELPPFAERVVTDHDGRFETSGSFEPGAMHAVLLEECESARAQLVARLGSQLARPALAFEHTLSSTEGVQLSLAIGPSYFVQCSALTVDSCPAYIAHLKSAKPDRSTFASAVLVPCTPHTGLSFLARFPPLDPMWRSPDEAMFELLHVEQHRAGRVVTSIRKAWPYPTVRVDLVPIGTLVARVLSDQGAPPDSVTCEVWSGAMSSSELDSLKVVIAGQHQSRRWQGTQGGSPGEWNPQFSARLLETGTYTIRIQADGFDDLVEVHTIGEGRNHVVCTLHRTALADGWIAGTVRTDSGAAPADEWVAYVHRNDPARRAQPEFIQLEPAEVGGRWVGRFRAEALVAGTYDVWIAPGPRVARARVQPNTSPRQREVAVGREDLRFDIHDEARTYVLEVTVLDGRDDTPLPSFELMLVKKENGIEEDPRPFAEGLARLELASDPSAGFVGVAAIGLAPEFQEVPALPDPDGVYRLRVRLGPGWAAPVNVLTLVDGKPTFIADAELLVDGSVAGKTDERGFCVLRGATRPTTLMARRAGYTLERCMGPIDAAGRLGTPHAEPLRESFAFILRQN